MSKPAKILTGEALFAALATLKTAVKWVRIGSPTTHIPAIAALSIARGGIYEGKVQAGRLRLIRETIQDARTFPDDSHHWDDRACLHYGKPVDSATVDLWDRILGAL